MLFSFLIYMVFISLNNPTFCKTIIKTEIIESTVSITWEFIIFIYNITIEPNIFEIAYAVINIIIDNLFMIIVPIKIIKIIGDIIYFFFISYIDKFFITITLPLPAPAILKTILTLLLLLKLLL